MIPPVQSSVWKEIVTGKRVLTSSKLAINLMAKNVQMSYQADPSPANVQALIQRVHDFFTAYNHIFAAEFKAFLG